MTKIICITNQKGGVGKTTSTACIAAAFQNKGYKVLCVDLDPQANLSFSCDAQCDDSVSIYEVLKGECRTAAAIRRSSNQFDIIPSNILLSGIELEYVQAGREFLLKEALSQIHAMYDYIFIDTPPALSILTVNALTACDSVLIPMFADIFSIQGIAQLAGTITRVKTYCNPTMRTEGIFLTKYDNRVVLSKEIRKLTGTIAGELNTQVFDTTIRSSIVLMELQANQENILDNYEKNSAIEDYINFTDELIRRGL